jgi:hypothetical protein
VIAIRKILKQWRWYHWTLTICAVLYLVYIALSYLYLPGKLKEVVQTDVAHLLGRDIQVQRIAFNPFTLALTVEQLVIADRPQIPLLAWNKLFVNFDAWGSLFGWRIRFSDVELDAPRIAIEQHKDGFNFSSILARLQSDKPAQAKPSSAFALQIDDIRVLAGLFRFDDMSGATPAHTRIDKINVTLKKLYLATGDDKLHPISLQAEMPDGGLVTLNGNYRADPLKANAQIEASDVHLEALKDFIANQIPLQLNSGRLSLRTDVDVEMEKSLEVLVHNGQLGVTDLALDDNTQDPPLLRGKQLQVQGIAMDLRKQRLHIEGIALNGFNTDQWLDTAARLRIQPFLGPQNAEVEVTPATTANKPKTKPWDFSIGNLSLQNTRLGFTDRRDGLHAAQEVQIQNAQLSNIHLVQGAQASLQLNAMLNNSGDLKVDGQIVPIPFSLDLHYQLQALALTPFNPYVEQLSWLRLQQGKLNAAGGLKMQSADPLPLILDLNAGVTDLKAQDSRTGKTVLQWKGLQLDQLTLELAQRSVAIDKVTLNAPEIEMEVDANKQMNLATLMKPATGASESTPAPETKRTHSADKPASAHPWQVAIHHFSLRQGRTLFRDASIKPVFKTGLYAINFKLDQLTSAGSKPATFTLTSKVDKYAPFDVKGTLAPLQQQPGFALTGQLRGLEMPALSPYTGTYIGYNLKSGRLSLDLQYDLKQHELQGTNKIVAKQLYLGDMVESEQALHVPIALGLALLRDSSGVIDLNLGVSGDLADPSFSIAGIVWKALLNIIVKAATSPFKLLASLVGSNEDLGSITFNAGNSELTADNQGRLQQLVKAMAQRPQLVVTVHGSADTTDDNAALQQQKVLEQIAARRKIPVAQLQLASLLETRANRSALRRMNDALKLPSVDQREAALQKADPKLNGDALTRQVYEQIYADVAGRQVISQQELINLADQRALAIKQYLVETAGLDHSRVHLVTTRSEDLKSRVCELGVEPG